MSELSNNGPAAARRNVVAIVLRLIMAVLARRRQKTVFVRMASRAVHCGLMLVTAAAGIAMISGCGVTNLADAIVIRIAIGKGVGTGFCRKRHRFVAIVGRRNRIADQKNIVAVGIMWLVAFSAALAFMLRIRVA